MQTRLYSCFLLFERKNTSNSTKNKQEYKQFYEEYFYEEYNVWGGYD